MVEQEALLTPRRLQMESIARDIRYALRSLARQRAFTFTAVAMLSLAIGVTAAIFRVVDATAIRGASVIEVFDWARLNRSFDDVAIYDGALPPRHSHELDQPPRALKWKSREKETSLNLRTAEETERIEAKMVSASFWSMVGARAQHGRTFTRDETSDGPPRRISLRSRQCRAPAVRSGSMGESYLAHHELGDYRKTGGVTVPFLYSPPAPKLDDDVSPHRDPSQRAGAGLPVPSDVDIVSPAPGFALLGVIVAALAAKTSAQQPADLVGLWQAKLRLAR